MNKEKILDTGNISTGLVLKNYKHLCQVLNEPVKAGNSKKAQLKEFTRYFDYTTDGYKIIITHMYDQPLDKIDGRGGATHYVAHSERMGSILLYLHSKKNIDGELFMPIHTLLKEMNMINSNYSFANSNRKKTSVYLDIGELVLEEFFDKTKQTFKRNVESMLDRLKNRVLIDWYKVKTVCVANGEVKKDSYGRIKINSQIVVDEYDNQHIELTTETNTTVQFRPATSYERELIVNVEWEVMNDLNCESKQEIVAKDKWKLFSKKVNEQLFNEANIIYHYDSYRITMNREGISQAVNELNEINPRKELNQLNEDVKNQIYTNTLKRKEAAHKQIEEGKRLNRRLRMRTDENYINDNVLMIDTFLSMGHKSITEEIKKTKINLYTFVERIEP